MKQKLNRIKSKKSVIPAKAGIQLNSLLRNKYLRSISRISDTLNLEAYLVGGAVRDMLQGKKVVDIDITVVGNPASLVEQLSKKWHAKVTAHPKFGTYVLQTGARNVDFATARSERYPEPALLPIVRPGTLKDDILRRDFTINTLAISLGKSSFGDIIDLTSGLRDLNKKLLKVLHEKSFIDDPTRIFRLARFASRGYKIERDTERLAVKCAPYISKLSVERKREEILAILGEADPFKSFLLLERWGIYKEIFPGMAAKKIKNMGRYKGISNRLFFMLADLDKSERIELLNNLKMPRLLKKEIEALANSKEQKPLITGSDLIKLGYNPGPQFTKMLDAVSSQSFKSRRMAVSYLFDKFPKNS